MGHKASLDSLEKRKIYCLFREENAIFRTTSPKRSRYTDCAIMIPSKEMSTKS